MSLQYYNKTIISVLVMSSLVLCVAMVITGSTWGIISTDSPVTGHLIVPDIQAEMQAVHDLHGHLDDDKNGQVDTEESEEFVREELLSPQYFERSKKFHSEETLVSSDELWNKWTTSKTHNWSSEQVVDWLINTVQLPHLAPVFREHHITGRFLPLIATNSGQFLSLLNISKHEKTKLQIKAMDVVLFGPPPSLDSHWKDTVMILSVVFCITGLTYAWRKQSSAHIKIDKFLEEIQVYESELQTLRNRVSVRNESTDTSSNSLKEEEIIPVTNSTLIEDHTPINYNNSPQRSLSEPVDATLRAHSYSCPDAHANESLRARVWELESQLENTMNDRILLKSLLQESCYSEWCHLETLRKKAEEDVAKAQKVCDKIKHKRSSVIGAFRLANSSTLEDAGLQITRAVNKMHKIAENFHKYHTRWKRIEATCHLSLAIASSHSLSDTILFNHSKHNISQNSLEGLSKGSVPQDLALISEYIEDIDYKKSQGGVSSGVSMETRRWCIESSNEKLDIIEEDSEFISIVGSETHPPGSNIIDQSEPKKHLRLNGFRKSLKLKHS